MIPESKFIRSEQVLRTMVLPEETKLTRKSLIRWLALAMGLISPKESRTLLLDVLDSLLYFHCQRQQPTTVQILEKVAELGGKNPHPKAVYYHLLNLKNQGFLHRKKGRYYLSEEEGKPLREVVTQFYEKQSRDALHTVEEALDKIEMGYR